MSKPQHTVPIIWSPNFAYAIGLIVTDGCLSSDGRHITFTSKDVDLINTFQQVIGVNIKVGKIARSSEIEKRYCRVQIGDVTFYHFLENIGLMPRKSKIIGEVKIPDEYFRDFLRGHFDGDGSFYSYFDPRWKSSYMYYTVFHSASHDHIDWLRKRIQHFWGLKGHVSKPKSDSCIRLKYAKTESDILLKQIYHKENLPCLERKRLKIFKALSIMPAK